MNLKSLNYLSILIMFFLFYAISANADEQAFHGVRYWVNLKTNFSYEPLVSAGVGSAGVSADLKLAVNLNTVVSPYIGANVGLFSYGAFIAWNIGVEKAFVYNNGFSIIPSLGTHFGECGYSTVYQHAGAHAMAEFAFSSKRFSPYLIAGIRYSYVFVADDSLLSFPLGAGLSIKI
jgi:hypothetical protein